MLAGIITVTSTTDLADGDTSSIANLIASAGPDGVISLREAIIAANNTSGADTIAFDFPATDARHFYYQDDGVAGTLSLANIAATTSGDDTAISDIDPDWPNSWFSIHVGELTPTGTTATGRGLPTLNDPVTIDGYTQGDATPGDGSDDAVENTNGTGQGINAVLKIELDGSTATENNTHGLDLRAAAAGSIIRGLVVNSFNGVGIKILGADNVQIAGNFIGTDASGSFGIANRYGVHIESGSENQIGGPSAALRNLVSGNSIFGVLAGGTDNTIAGNLIGTDRTGELSIPNLMGVNSGGVRNTVGGLTADYRNIISGNTPPNYNSSDPSTWGYGVFVNSGAVIWGNYVGTNVYGNAALPNHVGVHGGSVGGALPGQGNVISGNLIYGIAGADRVEGNFIGTDVTGATPIPNETGVFLGGGSGAAGTVGGLDSGARNVIAFSNFINVRVDSGHYAILGNSIIGNPRIGNLDLVGPGFGRDSNDPLDADSGPNDHQNYPSLTSVQTNGTGTVVTGSLQSLPNTQFRVEFFSNPDGSLQGQTFIGTTDVTTDSSGNVSFTANFPAAIAAGRFVTSTATDLPRSNTSEFSDSVPVVQINTPPIADANGPYSVVAGGTIQLDGSGTTDAEQPGATLTYDWDLDGDGSFGETGSAAARGNETGVAPTFSAAGLSAGTTITIALRVTDSGGLTSTDTATINVISVAIQPDPCDPGKKALAVGGTISADHIVVEPAEASGQYVVTINGVSQGSFSAPSGYELGIILVYAQAGNDNVQIAGSIALDAWLYGDDGDDRLKGGAGNDVLLGSSGDDLLVGGSGRDLLIGGTGADRIVGDPDDDILIAGSTAFDANEAALCAIMDEWTSTRSYDERRSNLTGPVTTGSNGSYFLRTDGSNATVFDDDAKDIMTGSSGQDWFFVNLESGVLDKITDLSASEFAEDLDFILGG